MADEDKVAKIEEVPVEDVKEVPVTDVKEKENDVELGKRKEHPTWDSRDAKKRAMDFVPPTPAGDTSHACSLSKRKYGLLVGFCGIGYQGMQINPGANSIELHLQKALFESGAIDPRNMERLQKISWMRCARTDKGVHAVGQIISCKLRFDKEVLDATNKHLPDDIRIFDYVQVTGGFDSKRSCEARTYEYTLRTEVLRPHKKHKDYEKRDSWVFGEEEQLKFRTLLKMYEGTHSYHNFTKGGVASKASCTRFIMNMEVSKPFTVEGMEFVRVTLKGQSFILHQIRKMIAAVSLIMRDGAPVGILKKLFGKTKIDLPMVPGLGLTLLHCHFDGYQRTRGKDREPLTFEHCEEEVHKFRDATIYSAMYKQEKEENTTEDWLASLDEKEIELDYNCDALKIDDDQ